MARTDPTKATDRWAEGMRGASTRIKEGVQNTDVNPMEEAAKNLDKYQANTSEAVSSGRMARKLRSVSKSDWQAATIAKADRVGTGATQAKGKMQKHLAAFLPHVEAVRQRVRAMPSATPEDRYARMLANARGIAEFKGS